MEKQPITVDIVIPTYKRPKLLCRAIESAVEQTYPYILQIIVTDDACDIETKQIVESYMNKDSRICYVCNTRYKHGPAGNKDNGMDFVKSDYFLILDDDDSLLPDAVERLVSIASQGNFDFVLANCRDSNGNYTGKHCGKSELVHYEDFLCGKFEGEYLWLYPSKEIPKLKFDDTLYGGEAISTWDAIKGSKVFYLHLPLRKYTTQGVRVSSDFLSKAHLWFPIYLRTLDKFGDDLATYCPRRLLYFTLLLFSYGKLSGQIKQVTKYPIKYLKKTKNFAFILPYFVVPVPKAILLQMWKGLRAMRAKRKQRNRIK